jgi:hypothetical protein
MKTWLKDLSGVIHPYGLIYPWWAKDIKSTKFNAAIIKTYSDNSG